MKKKIIVVAVLSILTLLLVVMGGCASDASAPVAQLYEATMRGDCKQVGELWQRDEPQKYVANCEQNHSEITGYKIIGVDSWAGIPILLEWARVKVRLEFTDRPPSESSISLVRRFPGDWELTTIR